MKDMGAYKTSTYCHICEGELLNDKVPDHCHLTGKFRVQHITNVI